MVTLVKHDLEFILKQIKIAEQNATHVDGSGQIVAGTPLSQLIEDPHLPYGLRYVDGSYNNLVPGRESYGSADQPMPRLTDPVFQNADPSIDIDGPGPAQGGLPTSYAQNSGYVFDSDPRTISNLIVDQTLANPAAIAAALIHAGYTGSDITAKTTLISARYATYQGEVVAAGNDQGAKDAALTSLHADLAEDYGIEMDGSSLVLPNVSPDEGLTAPFNSWFTLFGQFFDHGLDLTAKGQSGTVFMALQPDDPLYVVGSHSNFMVLTRATNQPGPDGVIGTADDIHEHVNTTTPWIDQNQTYTSHASHQVFLRDYDIVGGKPLANGHLLESAKGGPATWLDTKVQAKTMLGINLVDTDISNVPLLATDEYGEFLRGPNGFALIVMRVGNGLDGRAGTDDDVTTLVEGNPANPVNLVGHVINDPGSPYHGMTVSAVRTGHAFLDDIAHSAVPGTTYDHDNDPTTPKIAVAADEDTTAGNAIGFDSQGNKTAYDNELLDRHFITGDGRGNENIGLTAVHHVFHSEHNRLVEHTKDVALRSGDLAFVNEWLATDLPEGTVLPTTEAELEALKTTLDAAGAWDGERLFQAARFTTEMQYQHLVFEEFARKIQPAVDLFVFNANTDIDPAIVSEFANVVYRFGHSMLTQSIDRMNADGSSDNIDLFAGFLNPIEFDEVDARTGAAAIIRGMTRQTGNEIDEFVTDVLRNQLVGLPLDLAALNIARARDTGVPSLNTARATFYEQSGSQWLKPYESWVDFAQNLKNPASVINFIAAYGTHASITGATTLEAKRDAAMDLVFGGGAISDAERLAFLRQSAATSGVNAIDMWIGGLAEKVMPFGGMLGSTFMYVFEAQMENLQNNDRFYYLTRTQGLNLINELEANSFASLVKLNTAIGDGGPHVPGELFARVDYILEMDQSVQIGADPTGQDPVLDALFPKVERIDSDGDGDTDILRFHGGEHVVLGGTAEDDTLIADDGDDTLWGDAGNDYLDGGAGVNHLHGGEGNDIIIDGGDISFMHGEEGDDVISAGRGAGELIFAGQGNDVVIAGDDGKEVFAGPGDDFILGGSGADFLLGNEGDDWMEAGDGFDTTAGDNSELFFNSTVIGHDVMFSGENEHDFDGESGDDIMVQGESVMRNEGMFGYDWVTHKGSRLAADIDLGRPIFTTDALDILRNRYDKVEGASGWMHNDVIIGDDRTGADLPDGLTPGQNETTLSEDLLTQAGVDRINGLRAVVGGADLTDPDALVYAGGNILLGGGGSDRIMGKGGDDIIDGDSWLNVRISIVDTAGTQLATVDSLKDVIANASVPAWNGHTLISLMLSRTIEPAQLRIVREILDGDAANSAVDTAVFWDARANYTITRAADGSITVQHVTVTPGVPDAFGQNQVSDGTDRLRNIERLEFGDGALNIIMGTEFNDNGQAGAANRPVLNGTAEADLIFGLAGNDVLNGNGGNDVLIGNAGNDALNGGLGDDTYQIGLTDGIDTITETGGSDRIVLAGGTLTSLAVSETTVGGGNDNLVIQFDGQQVTVVDHFETTAEAVESINLDGVTFQGFAFAGDYALSTDDNGTRSAAAGINTLLAGTTGNDTLVGDTGSDLLFGHDGNDNLDGGVGNDLLVGGAGNDTMTGGVGLDTMVGGVGNDVYIVDNAGDVVVEAANGGTDEVRTTLNAYTLTADVENLTFTGAGAFVGTGNALANRIVGGAGVDTLAGLGGDDTYVVTACDVIVEAAGGGTDTVESAATYTLGGNVENLTLTGNGAVNGTGNGLDNVIIGNGNNNILSGLDGADTLIGAGGADTLNGGNGNDWLSGGADADTLDGGANDDIIVGGTGNDTINMASGGNDILVYNATGSGADTVNGFDADPVGGQDRIDLSGFGITAATLAARVTEAAIGGGTRLTITDANNQAVGSIQINGVAPGAIDASDYILATGTIVQGSNAGNTLNSAAGNETINGNNGNDTIIYGFNAAGTTNDGRDIVNGGAGTDTFEVEGSNQNETFRIYTRAAALQAIPGLTLAAGSDIVITRNLNSDAATAASVIAELSSIEEIAIDGNGGTNLYQVIGDFSATDLNLSTITINGSDGDDTVDITGLDSDHRIVFRSNGGSDTIIGDLRPQDVIELTAGTAPADYTTTDNGDGTTTLSDGINSITYASSGAPAIAEVDEGGAPDPAAGFALTASDLAGLKAIVAGVPAGNEDFESVVGVRELSGHGNNVADPDRGTADHPFIRLTEAHYGNFDAATGNYALNPIFDGLDARAISNILGTQEANLPKNAADGNIFFMAFGQYFDHGLDFLPKGGNGTVEIGGPGSGHAPGTDNPADLTRGTVHAIVDGVPQHLNLTSPYVDQNQAYGSNSLVGQFLREGDGEGGLDARLLAGAPDPSNPAFNLLPTLRELIQHHWANDTIFHDPSLPGGQISFRQYYTAYPVSESATGDLLNDQGAFDPQVVAKLAASFMGTGHSLLLDANPFISLLDHYVAGDGRANENFALTAVHTIWARNHNFHVQNLEQAGFDGTAEELFQAAKVINEAEYARVVFDEFADTLIGGMKGDGTHGFLEYNPDASAGISHEFAAAVYRVGHSLISDTLTVIGPDGQPRQVALFDAFLNPTDDASAFTMPLAQLAQYGYVPQPGYEQLGVSAIVGGTIAQQAEEVDFNIVNAVRNDLVRINADLFAFNVARGRDVGLGTLNQIRADLKASQDPYIREALSFAGNLDPYTSWEDFQARNGLSDTIISQFKQAYPDLVLDTPEALAAFVAANPDIALIDGNTVKGIDRVDLWVGGLAETHINGGMVGQTFWVVLHEQFDRLQEADRFYYVDRLDNFDFYENIIDGQSFSDIIARNTGLTGLPERVFEMDDEDDAAGEGDGGTVGHGDNDDDDDEGSVGGNDDDEDDDDDTTGNGDGDEDDDQDDDTDGNGDDEDDDETSGGDDDDCGCDDGDGTGTPAPSPGSSTGGNPRVGTALGDVLIGTAGNDSIIGLAGDDVLIGEAGDDAISAGEGADFVNGGEGRDTIFAGAGDDHVFAGAGADMVYGEAGDDRIFGEAGDDIIFAGAGKDTVVAGSGNDLIVGEVGDGDDVYFGDGTDGGSGVDTLDLSVITANLSVDLGNGLLGRGSAVSAQSGSDTLWSIENVATGSGNDTITASDAANVMEGGAGNDTFRFLSVQGADGDTILDFQPGDRLDLSAIDADTTVAGNQSFALVSGPSFTASAQLMVSYEVRDGVDYTVVKGNVDGGPEEEFRIDLKGSHTLGGGSFNL